MFIFLFQAALLSIVLRDSFAAPEKDIFQALMNWCKHNPKENHAEIMQAVRLPLMSLTELLNVVRPSGLLSPDAILDAIKIRSESRDMDLNYRGMLSKHQGFYLFGFFSFSDYSCLEDMVNLCFEVLSIIICFKRLT